MKGQPSRLANGEQRARLISALAPGVQMIARDTLRIAPYAIQAQLSPAQESSLIDHAIELGGPPGAVIGRPISNRDGPNIEILMGWERLQAYLHPDAYPRATTLPIALIDCNASHAAFYAIEHAYNQHRAAGWGTSPLLYAAAAAAALDHFGTVEEPWAIQTLANALCINRSTLSNRLRLLKGLQKKPQALLQSGRLKPEFAKILLAERSPERQERLAEQASKGMISTRALYKLVHPQYQPPVTMAAPRGHAESADPDVARLEVRIGARLGTTPSIRIENHRGIVELPFHDGAALQGLLTALQHTTDNPGLLKGHITLRVDGERESTALLRQLDAFSDQIIPTDDVNTAVDKPVHDKRNEQQETRN